MTTRKRNLIIAAAAAIVIAAAAVITVVTLNTQSEAEKVNNALAMMSNPDQTVSDVSDNRNAAVTVGGSDNDTSIIIDETKDTSEADGEDVPDESADVSVNDNDNDNAEKENTPDDGTTSSEPSGSTEPSGTTKPADTSKPDYPEAPDQGSTSASSNTQTNKPAVTVVTTAPAVTTPPSTVRDDLPKVTAEPKYTTAPTEKPAQTEPTVVDKTDSNGFPANPVDGQIFIDSDGNRWEYVEFIGWGEANGPAVILQEFPDFYVEGGDEIILS